MIIGERLRLLREAKKPSQGDIEKRTGLLPCYISRVENGHTVPSVETLEKLARALEMPLYQIVYEADGTAAVPHALKRQTDDEVDWGSAGRDAELFAQFRRVLGRIAAPDRRLLLAVAQKMARTN